MKSTGSSKKFPASQVEVAAAFARAPGKDRPLTDREEAKWSAGVMVMYKPKYVRAEVSKPRASLRYRRPSGFERTALGPSEGIAQKVCAFCVPLISNVSQA